MNQNHKKTKNRDNLGRFVVGHKEGMTGNKHTREWKTLMSKKFKGRKYNAGEGGKKGWVKKGQHLSRKTEFKKGQISPFKGKGITPFDHKFRMSKAYLDWRMSVLKRDNFTCQICGKRGGILRVDHIKPYSLFEDLRLELNNGRTLCFLCNKKTDTYGIKVFNYNK